MPLDFIDSRLIPHISQLDDSAFEKAVYVLGKDNTEIAKIVISGDNSLRFLFINSDYGLRIIQEIGEFHFHEIEGESLVPLHLVAKYFHSNETDKLLDDILDGFNNSWRSSTIFKFNDLLVKRNPEKIREMESSEAFHKESHLLGALYALSLINPKLAARKIRELDIKNNSRFDLLKGWCISRNLLKQDKGLLLHILKRSRYSIPKSLSLFLVNQLIIKDKNKNEVIRKVVELGYSSEAFIFISTNYSKDFRSFVLSSLRAEDSKIRILAAKTIIKTQSKAQVKKIMREYYQEKYYYDVVSILDKFIYYPFKHESSEFDIILD